MQVLSALPQRSNVINEQSSLGEFLKQGNLVFHVCTPTLSTRRERKEKGMSQEAEEGGGGGYLALISNSNLTLVVSDSLLLLLLLVVIVVGLEKWW